MFCSENVSYKVPVDHVYLNTGIFADQHVNESINEHHDNNDSQDLDDHQYATLVFSNKDFSDHEYANSKVVNEQLFTVPDQVERKAFVRKRRPALPAIKTKAGDFPSKCPGESLLKAPRPLKTAPRPESLQLCNTSHTSHTINQPASTTNIDTNTAISSTCQLKDISILVPPLFPSDSKQSVDKECSDNAWHDLQLNSDRVVLSPIGNKSLLNRQPSKGSDDFGDDSTFDGISYSDENINLFEDWIISGVGEISDHIYSMQIPVTRSPDHNYSHVTDQEENSTNHVTGSQSISGEADLEPAVCHVTEDEDVYSHVSVLETSESRTGKLGDLWLGCVNENSSTSGHAEESNFASCHTSGTDGCIINKSNDPKPILGCSTTLETANSHIVEPGSNMRHNNQEEISEQPPTLAWHSLHTTETFQPLAFWLPSKKQTFEAETPNTPCGKISAEEIVKPNSVSSTIAINPHSSVLDRIDSLINQNNTKLHSEPSDNKHTLEFSDRVETGVVRSTNKNISRSISTAYCVTNSKEPPSEKTHVCQSVQSEPDQLNGSSSLSLNSAPMRVNSEASQHIKTECITGNSASADKVKTSGVEQTMRRVGQSLCQGEQSPSSPEQTSQAEQCDQTFQSISGKTLSANMSDIAQVETNHESEHNSQNRNASKQNCHTAGDSANTYNDVLERINSIINQNKSKVHGPSPEKRKPEKCVQNVSDVRKRIEELLQQNEAHVSQTSIKAISHTNTKVTLADKIRLVKETLENPYPNPELSPDDQETKKVEAVKRIEQLIADNDNCIQNAPKQVENELDNLQTLANVCDFRRSKRKRSWSFTQGQMTRSPDVASSSDVQGMLVMKKAEIDSVHDHAYFIPKTTKPIKISKPCTKITKSKSSSKLKPEPSKAKSKNNIIPIDSSEQSPLTESPDIESSTDKRIIADSKTECSNTHAKHDSSSRAIIRDHTYEEDKVNTQQFSIMRDHSYKKLKKNKRKGNSNKAGTSDHTYTPNP